MTSPANTITEVHLDAGALLYQEGDENTHAFVIQSGEVVLFYTDADGRHNIERRGAGAVVGEVAVLRGGTRSVSVQALKPCVIFRICASRLAARFDSLDPVLRACVDTSIAFSTRLQTIKHDNECVPLATRTVCNPTQMMNRFHLETGLIQALGTDQFHFLYQPIVALPDGAIIGVEALMRWTSPTLGTVRPDIFIATAEDVGVMQRLTEFAITRACQTLQHLQKTQTVAAGFFITVNISAQDIGRADFVDHLAQTLDRFGLEASCLKLELTETALIHDTAMAAANLRRVRALGCGVSVDDFGTGYSNLAYLKSVPLTAIKIDRSFAGDAHGCAASRAIVSMLVALGRDIGVEIIAEGLETQRDVETLTQLGCHIAQGFHFYRPLSLHKLLDIIARQYRNQSVA